MSFDRVFLGKLLSSRACLRFPASPMLKPTTPVRPANHNERQTGLFLTVSTKGVIPLKSAQKGKALTDWSGLSFFKSIPCPMHPSRISTLE
jgi:hypothetical protein